MLDLAELMKARPSVRLQEHREIREPPFVRADNNTKQKTALSVNGTEHTDGGSDLYHSPVSSHRLRSGAGSILVRRRFCEED